jgi:hypothetical protein
MRVMDSGEQTQALIWGGAAHWSKVIPRLSTQGYTFSLQWRIG